MNDEHFQTLAQLQAFVDGSATIDLAVTPEERYGFISRTLCRFEYRRLGRAEKAVVLRFLERVSGYSRQQLTRLIQRTLAEGALRKRSSELAHQLLLHLHPHRCATAGAHRYAAWHALGAGHQKAHGARLAALWRCPL